MTVQVNAGHEDLGVPHPESSSIGEQVQVNKIEKKQERLIRLEMSIEYWWGMYKAERDDPNGEVYGVVSSLMMVERSVHNLQAFYAEMFERAREE